MMFGLVSLFKSCADTFKGCSHSFSLMRLTDQQVVLRGEVDELRRRFDKWLSPNAMFIREIPLFYSAITALTIERFDKICPIICLFIAYGVDLAMKSKNGEGDPIATRLAKASGYNRRLTWLAVTCGADFRTWKSAYAQESQKQVQGDRGSVFRLRQEGDRLYDQNYYADAVSKYQEALTLLQRFCEEEHSLLVDQADSLDINPIDRSHPAIVETYETLLANLSARLNKTGDLRDGVSVFTFKSA